MPPLARPGVALAALLLAIGCLWWTVSAGIVSSNDGSHLALARALALRRETKIDPDVSLTLWVDRARRERHDYSDRPPGTAFAALPAVWLGGKLDPVLLRRSLESREVVVTPAGSNYLETYQVRVERHGGPPLLAMQGSALAAVIHGIAVGLVGLWIVSMLLNRYGVGQFGRWVAVGALGCATLYGPYSTVLFAHVSAAVALIGLVGAAEWSAGLHGVRRVVALMIAGACGGWAISCDYSLVVAVVPLAAFCVAPRDWSWLALGSIPIASATLLYHSAAFGSPWHIGYDFHTNFAFARSRTSTFSGGFGAGLWTLWGLGNGAGVLAQSPIVLIGLAGLGASATARRWLFALAPWVLLLAFHKTPWGGATMDHRYLVPMLPMAAVGIGLAWQRFAATPPLWRRTGHASVVLVAAISAALVWDHFFGWRDRLPPTGAEQSHDSSLP